MRKIKLENTNCDKEHLICMIVMTSTQRLPRTVSNQLNRDNEKQALFDERSMLGFLLTPHIKD